MIHFLLYLSTFAAGFYLGHPGGAARVVAFVRSKL